MERDGPGSGGRGLGCPTFARDTVDDYCDLSNPMTKDETLKRVAEQYQSEGYRVTTAAGKGVVPAEIDHLREHIDLIAQKEGGYVVVEDKRRDQLYEINPLEMTLKRNLPGFRYDLVVYPPDGIDGIPLEDGEPSSDYV